MDLLPDTSDGDGEGEGVLGNDLQDDESGGGAEIMPENNGVDLAGFAFGQNAMYRSLSATQKTAYTTKMNELALEYMALSLAAGKEAAIISFDEDFAFDSMKLSSTSHEMRTVVGFLEDKHVKVGRGECSVHEAVEKKEVLK